ncbi:hypothetical protein EJ05DRAFT_521293 [Pseudovirgaria hyperparasitica]|uniref:F-box domain-containing protein n=1 Tax=Pseudovirgaria hyperparasitica TaxID=470096 RepID=A0A6A6VXL2_9PEZI|nr:uncharacterized protein EJ05DRAFT_521293 [Pseudovirgaria hyperparasitica]KAF2754007.1 hypothetical protein EJ05DRAFT_521293 [Pseudovirgaria hyperparasitica]
MGTRGLYSYRYRGIYYTYYNRLDSYPTVLGTELAEKVPNDRDSYLKWLENMRSKYEDMSRIVEKFRAIPNDSRERRKRRRLDNITIDAEAKLYEIPSDLKPDLDICIEWTYEFDLDYERFVVQGYGSHDPVAFDLFDIQTKWSQVAEELEMTLGNDRKLPEHLRDLLHKAPESESSLEECSASNIMQMKSPQENPFRLQLKLVVPKTASALLHKPVFAWASRLFNILIDKHHSLVPVPARRPIPISPPEACIGDGVNYHELMFLLLTTATHSPALLRVVRDVEVSYKRHGPYMTIKPLTAESRAREFATEALSGFYLEGQQPGNISKSHYWLEGVLVIFSDDLCADGELTSAMEEIFVRGLGKAKTIFYGLAYDAFSHIAFAKINGKLIEHSNVMVFADLIKCDESTISLEWRGLPVTASRAFAMLALVFEEAQLLTLKPRVGNSGVFPNEIYQLILSHVHDPKTHEACLRVSRAFRDLASRHLPLTDDVELRKLPGPKLGFFHSADQRFMGEDVVSGEYFTYGEEGYDPEKRRRRKLPSYLTFIGRSNDRLNYLAGGGFNVDISRPVDPKEPEDM